MIADLPQYSSFEQAFSLGNGQDSALRWLSHHKIHVAIFLVSGIKLEGCIEEFDQYSLLLSDANGHQQLIYKAKISTIAEYGQRSKQAIERSRQPRAPFSP